MSKKSTCCDICFIIYLHLNSWGLHQSRRAEDLLLGFLNQNAHGARLDWIEYMSGFLQCSLEESAWKFGDLFLFLILLCILQAMLFFVPFENGCHNLGRQRGPKKTIHCIIAQTCENYWSCSIKSLGKSSYAMILIFDLSFLGVFKYLKLRPSRLPQVVERLPFQTGIEHREEGPKFESQWGRFITLKLKCIKKILKVTVGNDPSYPAHMVKRSTYQKGKAYGGGSWV